MTEKDGLYATAGERVYGTRTNRRGKVEDYHHCTVRHNLYLGELPDFPACLGDWQQKNPPRQKQAYYLVDGTATTTSWVDMGVHGGGAAPVFGTPWNGETWWRVYDHGGDRASLHYDLRFRGTDGTCTWGMDRMKGVSNG